MNQNLHAFIIKLHKNGQKCLQVGRNFSISSTALSGMFGEKG